MQARHTDRYQYFKEEGQTTEKYFMPYIEQWGGGERPATVLEVGCGEGGNLLPFAIRGCDVTGVDMCEGRIAEAQDFFERAGAKGRFICSDILKLRGEGRMYDLIIIHDVVEHIKDKAGMMAALKTFLAPQGVVFVAFPAWQMPFGGHQQIASSKTISHLPFIHLLPKAVYRKMMMWCGEKKGTINELMSIKETRCTIEMFNDTARQTGYKIENRQLYFINPHYETKFGLRPRKLSKAISHIPVVRDFFSTSCFYILSPVG